MSTDTAIMMGVDIIAIVLLVFAVYLPRHQRADLVVAFIGVNIGVLGVSLMLADMEVSAGVGLGLFGVLSIIRLRSSEISQTEIAYFFAALATGLIAGLSDEVNPIAIGAIILIVLALVIVDSQLLFGGYFVQEMTLDRAITDQDELKDELEDILDAQILGVTTHRVDIVNDTTWVQVRGRRSPLERRKDTAAKHPESAHSELAHVQ